MRISLFGLGRPGRAASALVLLVPMPALLFGNPLQEPARNARVVQPINDEIRRMEAFDPAASAGLFVGIREFDRQQFAAVPFAVDDAVDLAYLFTKTLGLLTPSGVVFCLSGAPQKAETRAHLEELKSQGARVLEARFSMILSMALEQSQKAGPGGVLFLTIATHGFSSQGSDVLLCQDSIPELIATTGIPVNVLVDLLAKTPSPRRVFLLDACRERLRSDARRITAAPDDASPMAKSFYDAIAAASGQAILAGATLGGYAYDDFAMQNGVFTGAVLKGLQGEAEIDERGMITVKTLSDYVNREVGNWIQHNKPGTAERNRGITRNLEGAAADMPLAVNDAVFHGPRGYRARRDAALAKLRETFKGRIGQTTYEEIESLLGVEEPHPLLEALIGEILDAGATERSLRIVEDYYRVRRDEFLALKRTP